MPIRLRISELMKAKGLKNAADLFAASGDRISRRTAFRLVKADGAVGNFSASTIEALADIFGVPVSQLFERKVAKR